ncbi:hypothetical protein FIBSPDRAFT_1050480 [Athelia psychrophila]|uniref:BTB domain-containing protein n=1 Tax=Athelia psychrophila TaxID=1759441 RepID=A0A166AQF4_9AGAM|nr:hypothetical protein FIBSPDRAFT_1050480 [Fibularhizoctonia sp. CBS 109695]
MAAFECFRICALYLNRGISPALSPETRNPHIHFDGYSLEIKDAAETEIMNVHPKYNWPGSDVTLIAQNVAYLLHRSNLRAVSEVFNGLFDADDKSYLTSYSPRIYLPGCHPNNIEAALLYIYPTQPGITIPTSQEQWQLIYDFAFTFKFDSLWIAASQHLGKDMDPMDKIRIGRRRGWAGVLRQGFEEFSRSSQRTPSPDSEDAKLIGYDGLRTIMERRLQHSLSIHIPAPIPAPIIDIPPIATTSTDYDESDMVSQPIFSPVETFINPSYSIIPSGSTTRVHRSPLPPSTATRRSLFIPGFLQLPSPLSALYENSAEHSSGGRSISKESTPRIIEVEDSTEPTALVQKPPAPSTSIHRTDGSAISPVVPSPAALAIPTAIRPQAAETAAVERISQTSNHATVISTEHRVSHNSSPPPSSSPARGIFRNDGPLRSSTPAVSLVVDAVPAKVEPRTPVDQNSGRVLSPLVDAGRSMSPLMQRVHRDRSFR